MKKSAILILFSFAFIPCALSQNTVKGTEVLCLPEQEFSAQLNMVYCPAFRAAWTSLSQTILNEPVKLAVPLALADDLNKSPFIPADKSNWYIKSGFIEKDIIKDIQRESLAKFGIKAPGIENMNQLREGILNYSLFVYRSNFEKSFEKLQWDYSWGEDTAKVKCFGVSKGNEETKTQIREQVSIYDYQNRDDFIIRIDGSNDSYELILAKIPPEENVEKLISVINERMSYSFPEHPRSADELIIPLIKASVEKCFEQLHGRYLANKGFEEYFIARAEQIVDFSLDQDGAEATVTGKLLLRKGPVPRIYAFDRPFFLMLRKKGSTEPSLAMWIYDTYFLLPTE